MIRSEEEIKAWRAQLLRHQSRAKRQYQRDWLAAQVAALDWVLGEDDAFSPQ